MFNLIVLFSFSVASSLLWLSGMFFYIYAKIGFPQLFGLPLPDMVVIVAMTFLPVIFLWLVVGLLYHAMVLSKQNNTINLLLAQTRRSADHAEAMVRTLMETQLQTRSALVLHNADLFIDELNDLLADIVVRLGVIQPVHTEMVWQRIGAGDRWAFCRVLLQNADNSPRFKEDLQDQIQRDPVLSNIIRTFCYRFEQMFTMLERHDIEHYLAKIFEEGALGRVYARFVEVFRQQEQETSFIQSPDPVDLSSFDTTDTIKDFNPQTEKEFKYPYEMPRFDDILKQDGSVNQAVQPDEKQEDGFGKNAHFDGTFNFDEVFNTNEMSKFDNAFINGDMAQQDNYGNDFSSANEKAFPDFQENQIKEMKQDASLDSILGSQKPLDFKEKADSSSPFGFLRPTR